MGHFGGCMQAFGGLHHIPFITGELLTKEPVHFRDVLRLWEECDDSRESRLLRFAQVRLDVLDMIVPFK